MFYTKKRKKNEAYNKLWNFSYWSDIGMLLLWHWRLFMRMYIASVASGKAQAWSLWPLCAEAPLVLTLLAIIEFLTECCLALQGTLYLPIFAGFWYSAPFLRSFWLFLGERHGLVNHGLLAIRGLTLVHETLHITSFTNVRFKIIRVNFF